MKRAVKIFIIHEINNSEQHVTIKKMNINT
jgi:hypothetical protein